ncbi:MAG: hypothetical protein KGI72_05440 [Patescibacteria group bacterium]|nr:hypothetical protein [Patescibacteria group bacterium]
MLITALLGIATSVVSELASWFNKKVVGTPLQGYGAFVVVLLFSFVGALAKITYTGGFSGDTTQQLIQSFSEVFAVSQVYFYLIAKTLNLKVQS